MQAVTENELKDAYSRHREGYGGKREDYFGPVYLAKEFGGTVEDFLPQCAFGAYDHGLDAYHVDEGRRNLYLFQFKWSEDHHQFKPSLRRLVDSGIERVFGNPLAQRTENDFLGRLRAELYEKQAIIDSKIKVLQDFDKITRDALMKERNDMLGGILKDIEKIVADYAKASGYDMVLNSRMLLYGGEQFDLTTEVLSRLNK